MTKQFRSIGCILGLVLMSSSLNGCVAIALAPTALTLAAESFSVHTTGNTITENLKVAILESKEKQAAQSEELQLAGLNYPSLPPRKPLPPQKKEEEIIITSPISTIGFFPVDTLPSRF